MWEKVVELCIKKLGRVGEAINIVRKTKSKASAIILSKYFQEKGETTNTIEFLLLSGSFDEAFKVASVNLILSFI